MGVLKVKGTQAEACATIVNAERLIRQYIRRTPVIEVAGPDFGLNVPSVILKLELLQHTGSFKPRGAFVNLLTRDVPAAGVVAASGGNHGVAVAFAARKLNVPATIFVPTVAAASKIERIRSYGANLVVTGDRYADALAAAELWTSRTGALPIHAFDDPETLLGQATVGLEWDNRLRIWIRCWSPSVEAGLSAASRPGTGDEFRSSVSSRGPRPH